MPAQMRNARQALAASGKGAPGNGVYERVKARLLGEALPPGARIQAETLADQLFVSATPVREALIRLAAERLVQDAPKAGFFVMELSAKETAGLYELQLMLLNACLERIGALNHVPGMLKPPDITGKLGNETTGADAVIRAFNLLTVHLARQSGNADIVRIIANINDRTQVLRKSDEQIFGPCAGDLLEIGARYAEKDFSALRVKLGAYLETRIARLPELFRILRARRLETPA